MTKVIRPLIRLALDYLEELAYWLDPEHVDIENARNRLERLRGVLGKIQTMTSGPTTNGNDRG